MADEAEGRLTALLHRVRPADTDTEDVGIDTLLHRIGGRSFAPLILLPALILVSPFSAIPGAPTMGMLIIVTVTVQAGLGRRHLWLPRLIMRRRMSAKRLRQAVDWLAGPAHLIDLHSRNRWRALTVAPMNRIVHIAIVVVALPWPLLEPLPMVTSIGAFAVALFGLGLLLRDGIYVLAGFAFIGLLGTVIIAAYRGLI